MIFWHRSRVYCGKCRNKVERVLGSLEGLEIECHGESYRITPDQQEKFRVNGPVRHTYLFFANGHNRVNKQFKWGNV